MSSYRLKLAKDLAVGEMVATKDGDCEIIEIEPTRTAPFTSTDGLQVKFPPQDLIAITARHPKGHLVNFTFPAGGKAAVRVSNA